MFVAFIIRLFFLIRRALSVSDGSKTRYVASLRRIVSAAAAGRPARLVVAWLLFMLLAAVHSRLSARNVLRSTATSLAYGPATYLATLRSRILGTRSHYVNYVTSYKLINSFLTRQQQTAPPLFVPVTDCKHRSKQ